MRITVDTYSDDYCQTFMGQDVPETLLCGGVDEGGISACIGDAGGPVTTTTSEVYLAGVMSHFGCTEPNCKPSTSNSNTFSSSNIYYRASILIFMYYFTSAISACVLQVAAFLGLWITIQKSLFILTGSRKIIRSMGVAFLFVMPQGS